MKGRPTISQVIVTVMRNAGEALFPKDVYRRIVERNLYTFHAQDPEHVVTAQIRRHCKDLEFPTAKEMKYFGMTAEGKFFALDTPLRNSRPKKIRGNDGVNRVARWAETNEHVTIASTLEALQVLHRHHRDAVKERILRDLKKMAPAAFERFAKRLLEVYGFERVSVTSVTRDGGIDGYGKLKVGLAHMDVAFQCKRWTKTNVGRPEVDKFRGAIQGEYAQGIFFTTAKFVAGAKAISIRRGAVPIVLVDGPSIVDLMIDKNFGVEQTSLPVYTYALDLVLGEQDQRPER